MPGIKFTKVVATTSPPPLEMEAKQDGVPDIKVETKEEERVKPKGIPLSIVPPIGGRDDKENDDVPTLSPETEVKPKRGRGRPPGSGKKQNGSTSKSSPKKTVVKQSAAETLGRQIEGAHAMADVFIPGMRIEHSEALLLGEAMQNVFDEFGISPSGKAAAILQLVGVVGIVEAPKIPVLIKFVRNVRKPANAKHVSRKIVPPTDDGQSDWMQQAQEMPKVERVNAVQDNNIFAHVSDGIARGEDISNG